MHSEASFGRWLQRQRKALDLTQVELARRVGCSKETIRNLESNERRPSQQIAARLAECLGLAPDQQTAFIQFARARPGASPTVSPAVIAIFTPRRAAHQQHMNLPVLPTRLIGREHELAAIRRRLLHDDTRLLTLIGPPGVGKTCLSLQTAMDLRDNFEDGACFVELAPIRDPALVVTAIARVLNIKEMGSQALIVTLKAYLHDRQLLLVLDNFEHLLIAVPLVTELLAVCPWLRVLATSRAVLNIRNERLFPVPPLGLPNLTAGLNVETIGQSSAVRLFIERTQAVQPSFVLTQANAAAISEICQRLDGLPLAIELAAARVKLFSPQTLLARLERRLQLLIAGALDLPARQQTLRATIDWSYRLLDAGEQALLACLSVFVGGCTLEAVEAVCTVADSSRSDVLDELASLVDQSLVRKDEGLGGEPRFTMLETIREYALEQLAESSKLGELRRQHADYYLLLAEAIAPTLIGAQQGVWLDRLEVEHDNLRMALQWAIDRGDGATAGRMSAALVRFWYAHSYLSEGRMWLEQALALLDRGAPMADVRAKVLNGAGILAYTQGDYGPAFARLQESIVLARESGDQPGTAMALDAMGWTALVQGDHVRARPFFDEGLALFQELGQTHNVAACLTSLGAMALVQGDYSRARAFCEKSLALGRAMGVKTVIGVCLTTMGSIVLLQGDNAWAQACFEECLALCQKTGNKLLIAVCLIGLAGAAAVQRQATRAAQLAGASESLLHAIGSSIPPVARPHYEMIVAATRFQLGEAAFAALRASGHALSLEQAIAYALNEDDRDSYSSPLKSGSNENG